MDIITNRRVMLCYSTIFCFILSTLHSVALASTKTYFEEIFSTAVVLANSDTISLGMGNFDPELVFNPDQPHRFEHVTESNAIQIRNQLSTINIPYTFVLDKKSPIYSDKLTFNFSYIKQDITNTAVDNSSLTADASIDKIYSAYFAYSKYFKISERWLVRYRLGSYVMHYENSYEYNNPLSQKYEDFLDGRYFNTIANSVIIEPNVKFTYTKNKSWGKWQFNSDFNYFKGMVYSGAKSSQDAKPGGWLVNNDVKVHFNVNSSKLFAESLYLKFQRTDLKGDMVSSLEAKHFYEFGIGMLLDTSKYTDFAENIGIGININKGSSLYGGSIVFYLNEF